MNRLSLSLVFFAVVGALAFESAPAAAYGWDHGPRHAVVVVRPSYHPYHRVHYDDHRGFDGPLGPRPMMHAHPVWAGPHIQVWDRWDRGSWTYSRYRGRLGWWWVVDGYWFMYPTRVYPYPDYTVRPLYVVEPGAPAVIVERQPVVQETVIVKEAPPAFPADQSSPTYTDYMGRTCREYQSSIIVGGVSKPAYGTACLQPDGTWRVVK